jgi:hypothetical protein
MLSPVARDAEQQLGSKAVVLHRTRVRRADGSYGPERPCRPVTPTCRSSSTSGSARGRAGDLRRRYRHPDDGKTSRSLDFEPGMIVSVTDGDFAGQSFEVTQVRGAAAVRFLRARSQRIRVGDLMIRPRGNPLRVARRLDLVKAGDRRRPTRSWPAARLEAAQGVAVDARSRERSARVAGASASGSGFVPSRQGWQTPHGSPRCSSDQDRRFRSRFPARRSTGARHGVLRASITHEVVIANLVRVGTNVEYARPLEFGTTRMAPRPFMRPAFVMRADKMSDA